MKSAALFLTICLITLSAASFSYFTITAPDLIQDTPALASDQVTPEPSEAVPALPVGALPEGVKASRQALTALPARLSNNSTIPNLCSVALPAAWTTYGLTSQGDRLAVAITPPGQGSAVYNQAQEALNGCSTAQVQERSVDSITVVFPSANSTWTLARYQDVIVSSFSVSTEYQPASLQTPETTLLQDPSEITEDQATPPTTDTARSPELAEQVLDAITPFCKGDPGSTQNNPLFTNYTPYAPEQDFNTPKVVLSPPSQVTIPSPARVEVPTYPRPEWSIVYPPNEISNPTNTPLYAAARGPAPLVPDPSAITPPSAPRPYSSLPQPVGAKPSGVTIAVPAEQVRGPGCGWAFSGATPLLSPEVQSFSLDEEYFAELKKNVSATSQWLSRAKHYELGYASARELAQNISNWREYDAQVAKAEAKVAKVRSKYEASLERWQSYTPPAPVVTPVPEIPAPVTPINPPPPTATPAPEAPLEVTE